MIVVVPARGGSSRIPRKNLAPLSGLPLLVHTLRCAEEAGLKDSTFVSTDDAEIARTTTDEGFKVIDRPSSLATDEASTESALLHALDQLQQLASTARWIMTLPPTAPLRTASTVRRFMALAEGDSEADSYIAVTPTKQDLWSESAGQWTRLFPDAPRREQDRDPLYIETSSIYLTRINALRETGSVLGRRTVGVEIPSEEGLDINTPFDLRIAEALLARRS